MMGCVGGQVRSQTYPKMPRNEHSCPLNLLITHIFTSPLHHFLLSPLSPLIPCLSASLLPLPHIPLSFPSSFVSASSVPLRNIPPLPTLPTFLSPSLLSLAVFRYSLLHVVYLIFINTFSPRLPFFIPLCFCPRLLLSLLSLSL